MRLVDAEELERDGWHLCRTVQVDKNTMEYQTKKPTAFKVLEVVRCKDCIYFDKYIDCKEMYQWDGFCADWARNTYENWYCSRAERRSDETD